MTETPGTRAAYAALYGLRRVEDLGLAAYVAGDAGRARHVMRLTRPRGDTYRTLLRGEAQPWAGGLGAGAGYPELGAQIAAQPVPALLTVDQAARQLGLSGRGVHYALKVGTLYPLYGNRAGTGTGRARYLFTAQVAADHAARALRTAARATGPRRDRLEAKAEEARQAWLAVRSMLPTPVPESMVGVDIRPLPSPDPLPLNPDEASPSVLAVRGLQVAEQHGWLTYHYPTGGGYAVTLTDAAGAAVDVTIPAEGLLAWLLGLADWHGRADLIAYREGLGG